MDYAIKDWINGKLRKEEQAGRNPWEWFSLHPVDQNDLDKNFVEFNNWPTITLSQWKELLKEIRRHWDASKAGEPTCMREATNDQLAQIYWPDTPESNWQVYLQILRTNTWSENDIDALSDSIFNTIRNLTIHNGPVKGLVIGQVQSGKTANFAGLMAMAADNGWNIFIVLSGTIEKLREQTQQRLLDDLMKPCNQNWTGLNKNPPISINEPQSPTRLVLGANFNNRYLTVCLKNSTRLRKLREWLHHSPEVAQKMKIIIIDDESDQAGINTLIDKKEITKINKLILEIVHGNQYNESTKKFDQKVTYGAMNYIGYTATPYANVLNQTERETLYPRDFIRILKPSKYYFGPARLFGEPETECLDVYRVITSNDLGNDSDTSKSKANDLQAICKIHTGDSMELPLSLKEAICWYLCSAGAFRVLRINAPSSMLIHTSHKIEYHSNIRKAVERWLINEKAEVLEICKKVWDRETTRLTLVKFYTQINSIEGQLKYPDNSIADYPGYESILGHIHNLLERVSHIELEDNGLQITQNWHEGLHICEDNCRPNDEDGFHLRLMYPPKNERLFSHAFIIIGGNTLSRGLTLEGLVSSYFLRDSTMTIDTLTQMGRWFGFRRGYELYPRIWMTEKTHTNFERISLSEKSLQEEISRYAIQGLKPSEFAPRILTHPLSRLNPTARNRMHAAKKGIDFSGNAIQTTVFYNSKDILSKNAQIVAAFLCETSKCSEYEPVNNSKKLWRSVPGSTVRQLLSDYKYHENAKDFAFSKEMVEWLEKQEGNDNWKGWSVALCGLHGNPTVWEPIPGLSIGKTNFRPYKKPKDGYNAYAFKTIRERKDLLIDVNRAVVDDSLTEMNKTFNELTMVDIWNIRKKGGLEYVPQLLVYCLDKDFADLSAPGDFIGLSIFFPGSDYRVSINSNYIQAVIKDQGDEEKQPDIDDADN